MEFGHYLQRIIGIIEKKSLQQGVPLWSGRIKTFQ
jgi:hypothetical protein